MRESQEHIFNICSTSNIQMTNNIISVLYYNTYMIQSLKKVYQNLHTYAHPHTPLLN